MGRAKRPRNDLLHELQEEGLPSGWLDYWQKPKLAGGMLPSSLLPRPEDVVDLAREGNTEFLAEYFRQLPRSEPAARVAADPLLDVFVESTSSPWTLPEQLRSWLREDLAEAILAEADWNLQRALFRYPSSETVVELVRQTAEGMSDAESARLAETILRAEPEEPLASALLLSDSKDIWPAGGGQIPGFTGRVYRAYQASQPDWLSPAKRAEDMFLDARQTEPVLATFPGEEYVARGIGPFALREAEVSAEYMFYILLGRKPPELADLGQGVREGLHQYIGSDQQTAEEMFAPLEGSFTAEAWQEFTENLSHLGSDPAHGTYLLLMRAAYFFNEGYPLPSALLRSSQQTRQPASPMLRALVSKDFARKIEERTGLSQIEDLRCFSLGEMLQMFPRRREDIEHLVDVCALELRQ